MDSFNNVYGRKRFRWNRNTSSYASHGAVISSITDVDIGSGNELPIEDSSLLTPVDEDDVDIGSGNELLTSISDAPKSANAKLSITHRSRGRGNADQSFVNRAGGEGDRLLEVIDAAMGGPALNNAEQENSINSLRTENVNDGDEFVAASIPSAGVLDDEVVAPPSVAGVAQAASVVDNSVAVDHNSDDGFICFGDVPDSVLAAVEDNMFAYIVHSWAFLFLVPRFAVTALLRLLHGLLGSLLGIAPSLLRRSGAIPRTSQTLYKYASSASSLLNLNLLEEDEIPLPADDSIRERGRQRVVKVWKSLDIAKNIAATLIKPRT